MKQISLALIGGYEFEFWEIGSITRNVAGQQGESGNYGVGANKEIWQRGTFIASFSAVFPKAFPRKERRLPGDGIPPKIDRR